MSNFKIYCPRERIEPSRVLECLQENLLAVKERTLSEISLFALGILSSAASATALLPAGFAIGRSINWLGLSVSSVDKLNKLKNRIGNKAMSFLTYLRTCSTLILSLMLLQETLKVSFVALSTLNPAMGLAALGLFAFTGGYILPLAQEQLFQHLYFSESSQEKENIVNNLLTKANELLPEEILTYQDSIVTERALSTLPIKSIKILLRQAPHIYTKELLDKCYLAPARRELLHLEEIAETTPLIESEVLKDWNKRVEAIIEKDVLNNNEKATLCEEKKALDLEEKASIVADLLAFASRIRPEKISAYQDFIVAERIVPILSQESIKTLMKEAPRIYTEELIKRAKLARATQEPLHAESAFLLSNRDFNDWNKELEAVFEKVTLNEQEKELLRKEKDILYKEWRMKCKTILGTVPQEQIKVSLSNLESLDFQPLAYGFLIFTQGEWERISLALNFPKGVDSSVNIQNGFEAYGLYIPQDFLDTKVEVMNVDTGEMELQNLQWLSVQEIEGEVGKKNLRPFINAIKTLASNPSRLPSVAPRIFPYQRAFHHVIKLTSVALWIALNPIPIVAGIAIYTFIQYMNEEPLKSLEEMLRRRTSNSSIPSSNEIVPIDGRLQMVFAKTLSLRVMFIGSSLFPGVIGSIATGLLVGRYLAAELNEYREQLFGPLNLPRENLALEVNRGEPV